MGHLLASLLACSLAAACSAPIGHQWDQDSYTAFESQPLPDFEDGSVTLDDVTVEHMRSTRPHDSGGRLRVEFDLVNAGSYRNGFQWRLRWLAADGTELDGPDHWRPITLENKETRAMRATSPTPEAAGWEIALRNGK
ncbi:MAG: DUF1425 domain-containing protein [Planctomycetota bacterium]|nr:DUF1425 domain-containing protein [Planctomycetota bacterium]